MIPLNPLLWAWLGLYVAAAACDLAVGGLNERWLKTAGPKVPEVFRDTIDAAELDRINRYTRDKLRAARREALAQKSFFIFLILWGFFPGLAEALAPLPPLLQGTGLFRRRRLAGDGGTAAL